MSFDTLAVVGLALLGVAATGAVVRVGIASSLADRVIALDLLVVIAVMAIAIESARDDTTAFLDDLMVVALLGFVATTAVARFIERRGAR